MRTATPVHLEPWTEHDLPLLTRLLGDPRMTEHLGGPESPQKLAERQERYTRLAAIGPECMYRIVVTATGQPVGSVGLWESTDHGVAVYETGWSVLPEYQGQGIATAATAQVIDIARQQHKHRYLHAYPAVLNHPSNAVCRKLGFTLLGSEEAEYPPGTPFHCNNWRLDLHHH